ncbi:hypothetical protein MIMGU_mgv1a015588mg [Erythranthe guttata]|uniref:Uncharacterized protein n=1 Tax=Erythranthe guttata TaxID=4155 RepID=A0A022QYM1_ERYGU|nr:hypothetical protein MIMGU_mgv1a015588mg [Erythranthe guttata]
MPGRVPPVRPAGSQISARPSPPPCARPAPKLLPTGPARARTSPINCCPPAGRCPSLPEICCTPAGRVASTLAGPVPKVRKFSDPKKIIKIRARRKLNLARWLSGPFSQISRIAPKTSGATSFCPRLLAPWAESPAPWLGRCRKSENFPTRKK